MNDSFFNRLQSLAGIMGAIGVIFGAFGAHFLKSRLDAGDLDTIKTGVLYLFIHTLATLFVCLRSKQQPGSRQLRIAGLAFVFGSIMFSGSLFIIGTASLTGFPVSTIGFITPLGGLCFILGWIFLVFQKSN
ncbi:MAG TPA: DUF423 domain-containing protein [Saprospiraceae bacterium]|nr:DUF423 domain-containing protein [Saprospiraceae bacterium]